MKVISRSAFDLQPVLDTLISSACRLCEADIGAVRYQDGSTYRLAADYGFAPGWRDHLARQSAKPDRGSIFGRTVVDGRTVHIPDVLANPEFTRLATQKLMGFRAALGVPLIREGRVFRVLNLFRISRSSDTGRWVIDRTPVHIHDVLSDEGAEFPEGQEHSRRDGFRSILSVPMLREGESIGAIALRRNEVQPFTDKQIALLKTFADQAVIAIANVRLFDEVQARTEDLSESLQDLTAASEGLMSISRSPDDW